MKDACKVMLDHITQDGRVRVGYGSSLLEEARAAGKGEITRKNTELSPATSARLVLIILMAGGFPEACFMMSPLFLRIQCCLLGNPLFSICT